MNQEPKNNLGQPSTAPPVGGQVGGPLDIHVMPQKFLAADSAGRKAKIIGLIIIISVLGVALTAAAFYLNYTLQNSKTTLPAGKQANANQVSQKNAKVNQTNQKTANQNTNVNQNEAVDANLNSNVKANGEEPIVLSSGRDSDNDGLTDEEEILYATGINNDDIDGDGYSDGAEVVNLYNPTGAGQLISSAAVDVFTSSAFDYSVLYPINWTLEVTEVAGQEVMFTSQTGEFVKIFVQDNPQQLSAKDWYWAQWPDSPDSSPLEQIEVNGLEGVWSFDKLNVYLAKDDKLYVIAYNIGERPTANFQTTFQMMVKSFELKD
ncbi:MAG: hypothetical protein V1684_01215 [bacterium]